MQNWVKSGHVGSRDPITKNAKLCQKWGYGGYVTQFWNFQTP